ncbi:hypothetical protein G7Y89_g10902 [Cudoniella acicularis]|uniref:Uncharacterized protein n=1 Tax=Cudoniella acicularis TaxID=354080 RepID=A0A8H4W154_9HELO|nr:hypothetical protein G7Y89_g10902 [Cudoniella acicularis]
MSRRKALNAASDDCPSYGEVSLSHISGESGFEDYLPEIVVLYPGELLKRYQERGSRGRRSGALLPESVAEEEHHEGTYGMRAMLCEGPGLLLGFSGGGVLFVALSGAKAWFLGLFLGRATGGSAVVLSGVEGRLPGLVFRGFPKKAKYTDILT